MTYLEFDTDAQRVRQRVEDALTGAGFVDVTATSDTKRNDWVIDFREVAPSTGDDLGTYRLTLHHTGS